MFETVDAYCRRFGLAGRSDAIDDGPMVGPSGSMSAWPPGDSWPSGRKGNLGLYSLFMPHSP